MRSPLELTCADSALSLSTLYKNSRESGSLSTFKNLSLNTFINLSYSTSSKSKLSATSRKIFLNYKKNALVLLKALAKVWIYAYFNKKS